MKGRRTTIGFVVIEVAEEWEQMLSLDHDEGYPDEGILDWRGGNKPFVFKQRADARAAIDRTEHYRLAFGVNLPEKKCCKIVPVETERDDDE